MPAISAIPSTSDNASRQTCISCLGLLAEAALKCKNCQAYVHLRCSGLAEYQLVRFRVTNASYVCATCVKTKDMTEEKYGEELTKVREIMAKEESLVEQVDKELNITELNITDTESRSVAEPVENGHNPSAQIHTSPRSDTSPGISTVASGTQNGNAVVNLSQDRRQEQFNSVCRHYLRKNCRHGIRGVDCLFQHPKICFKWQRNGSGRGGCNKENCSFLHPKLCQQSLGSRTCNRRVCKYYHLKGTTTTDQ